MTREENLKFLKFEGMRHMPKSEEEEADRLKRKNLVWLFIILLLFPTTALINMGTASPTTTLYVDPPISAKEVTSIGQEFHVRIRVSDVDYLYGWQLKLQWNPNLLNAVSLEEGSFLKDVGETRLGPQPPISPINNTLGLISAVNTLLGVEPFDAPSGTGTLLIITFQVKAKGECRLRLSEDELYTFTDPTNPGQPVEIKHDKEHGYFKFPLPILYVEPSSILNSSLVSGFNFTININIAKVTNLTSWQFSLEWDSDLLNATSVTEGSFLSQNGTHETTFLQEINQTEGYVRANSTLVNPSYAVSGNGTIATITFLVEAIGDTSLLLPLDEARLLDNKNATIHFATDHGFFSNALRDIAVTKVEASSTTVKAGDSVTIKVTVKNEGIATETSVEVSVTTPSPPSPTHNLIGTGSIPSLEVGQEKTLNFTWNTKKNDKGDYRVLANATAVPGEVDREDNVGYVDVEVTSPGEFPTMLIVAVILAVVVIGVGIFLYIRRKSPRV